MASQVAFNSPAYSAMSASSSSSASVGSATLASLGTGSQEETERLLRHVTEDAGLRKEALDALIRAARRGSGRLSLRSPLGLFQPVSLALRDPDWEVRNKAINLLVEVTPRFGQQLSEGMAEVLPGLVACLADIKVANRRATTQCLHTYMKTMGSANTEPVLGAIIRYGLDAADPEIQRNVCVSVPVLLTPDLAGGNFSQLVAALAKCLTSKDEAMANAALHALEAIRSTLGDQLFNGYLQQLNPPLRRYYFQVSGHVDPSLISMATAAVDAAALSRSPNMQRRPIPGISDSTVTQQYYPTQQQQQQQQQQQYYQPAKQSTASNDAFGCVPRNLVDQLDDREEISLRAQAIEDLRTHLRQLDTLEAAVPHLEKFLAFLHSLLDDVNFRIAIVTLDILYLLANRLGSRLQPHLRSLLAGITKRMSDGKNVVRTALMKLAILLMHNHRPQIVLDLLLNNLEHRNSRVRQETLNMTISALVTFPSSDFDLPRLCNCIAPALLDPKRQVRHAALEVMALLAQGLGSGRLQPLQLAVREQETRPDATGLFEAVMSRLAKRQLPRLSAEGLVEYAIPVPSSATRRPQAGGAAAGSGGANEDWVMQASAGGYGSAKSRSELVDLETDSLASERRKSSAGRLAKGKLPWEPAASEPAPAPSQEVGRAKQKPPQQQQQQQQQATHSNDPASSTSVLNSRQQPQAQPPKAQPPQAESPAGHQGGPSAYVTNGRVKKFSEIPTDQQPRKVKRFLDQSEKPELQQGGDTASPGNQWSSGPTAKGSYLKNLEKQSKPRLVKSKRPELITSDVLDDLPSTSRSVASSQPQQAAPDQEGSAGKLPAIPKQQQQKRASDSVAASEAKNKRQGGPSYDSGNGDAAEAASPVPMKPQLARSAGKKPKRATAGPSNPPSDSGVGAAAANYSTASSTAPSSTRGSQIDAAEEHPPPEEINGSLHYIRHSASRKKALKVFENAESNHGAAGGKSSGGSGTAPQAQDLPPEATGGGPQTRYNPHQGATFRPNPSYHSEVVGRAYGDDQASSSGFGDFGDGGGSGSGGTPPASVVRGRQQQRKHLRGTYSSSPIQAASVLDSDNADSGLQRGGREFNIVGRGVFEVQPAAVSPLPRAEVLTSSGGFGSGSGGNVSSAPSAVATDSSALSGGVQGTAYRPNLIGNGGPDDEEDSAPSDRGRQQQQQQLQRTLSNTLRESVALRQRQRAAAERSASKAETEDERLIRELREGSANADTAQLSHRQQQEQTVSDSDSNLAKELREEQLAISKRHTDSIGVDSDSESTRGSVRNYALASLNRKVSDQSFSAAPDAAAAAASPAASKPPAPRRNLSRPLRPSPSQTGPPSSSESLQSSAPAASGPLANPDRSLQEALTRVQASDWQAKCEGLQLVQRLAANHPEVAAREMHPLTLAVIGEVKNLRSQVSRLAMSTLGCLLQHLGKRMDAELEQCAKILLQKGSETNKFIQEDAESALMSMVEHCNQGRALGAIIQGGASHKSSQVRSLCAQILSELCDRMGPGRVLSGVKDVTDKLLATAANFCLDGSQETRYWGRTILYPLLGHQDFDALISKHVSPAVMRNLKDVLENLRLKGVGDQPPSTFSAGTKSRRGNSAGSADSASLAGSYASTSTTGQSAPLGRQRGAAGSNSRLSDAAADLVKTACQRLNAPDWKERLSGIDQLAELSQERTDLVGQCIVKFMDAFAPRLGDSNSKVQQHALETALQLVHPLRNYLPTVANTLVQHAAPVLSSKSAELASLAGQLLDIFILEVDSEKLAQPFVQAVATGNPRSKPELVDKLAALAERLAPRKPRLSQLHLEPELFRLLGGLASAPGAGSVALKSSAYRLAQTLASYSGPAELLDRARSNAQCTPQAVSMLEDALRQY